MSWSLLPRFRRAWGFTVTGAASERALEKRHTRFAARLRRLLTIAAEAYQLTEKFFLVAVRRAPTYPPPAGD